MWSFELSNTNIWQKEVYTIAIYDVYQQNPWIWRNQVLKSDETAVLNYDNIGWFFCQGCKNRQVGPLRHFVSSVVGHQQCA